MRGNNKYITIPHIQSRHDLLLGTTYLVNNKFFSLKSVLNSCAHWVHAAADRLGSGYGGQHLLRSLFTSFSALT